MAGHYHLWKHQTRSCKWLQARSSTSLRLIFLSPPLPILLPHNSSAGLHAEARNPLDRSADTASPDSPGAKPQPDCQEELSEKTAVKNAEVFYGSSIINTGWVDQEEKPQVYLYSTRARCPQLHGGQALGPPELRRVPWGKGCRHAPSVTLRELWGQQRCLSSPRIPGPCLRRTAHLTSLMYECMSEE